MSSNKELQARRDAAVARGLGNLLPIYVDRAENAEIWDVEGKRYIDFASGIAVLNTGHLHPRVKAAVQAQLERFSHTCFMVTPYESGVELAEKLNALAPIDGPAKSIFVTTGAEAVENAVKIARAYTKRSGVITFGGGFHGRTLLAMALTGKVAPYKASFGPMPAEVFHAPFPVAYHGVSVQDSLEAIEHLFKWDIEPGRVAAIILEPVQGEGGFYVAPKEFLQALRKICDEHGIVLVSDEIQAGFARTGKMFAIEHSGVKPDLITMAKSLAGGFPIAAVTGKAEIMDAPHPGGLGGTYAGSPLGTTAALAVLDVIQEENLCERSLVLGDTMVKRLKAMQKETSCIGDVRNLGAMVAIELVKNGDASRPDADLTKALVGLAAERGLILLSCGVRANVIRFLPPITASEAVIHEGLDILRDCLMELISSDKVA
ncbi:MAG: 4-aminobutyrate--2-oxoglutarate transaminase [Gammaproteobacteria bacterium]|nr:4-aminobutyrate--2-oxoglutarate transaminase [Gammaproteobacteria bacterium]